MQKIGHEYGVNDGSTTSLRVDRLLQLKYADKINH